MDVADCALPINPSPSSSSLVRSSDESHGGKKVESQESPVETEQSCMSLRRFGVTNVNRAEMFADAPSGASYVPHSKRPFV
jgi:hypothetical protein